MNLKQYQELAGRTRNNDPMDKELSNYALGLAGETGEVVEIVKKHVHHGHELNREELEKELGDVLWYLVNVASVCNIRMEDVARNNIEKLMKRYPEGFSTNDSIKRVDVTL